jgi:hypothetical protein
MNINQKNFGYGKLLRFAGESVLRLEAKRAGGRYAWLKTNTYRWRKFCRYCQTTDINDARKISSETVFTYAKQICELAPASQQCAISTINIVMALLTGANWEAVSPSKITGTRRSNIRRTPGSIDKKVLSSACFEVENQHGARFALAVALANEFGLRRRETLLFEFHTAQLEIKKNGFIDIFRGSKGGRSRAIPRLVRASETGIKVIETLCQTFPKERCLLFDQNYKNTSDQVSRKVLPILKQFGINRFHELRVNFACRRYKELTRIAPPCDNDFIIEIDKLIDQDARSIISEELGHSRVEILNRYIGSIYAR